MIRFTCKTSQRFLGVLIISMCAAVACLGITIDEYDAELDKIDGLLGELHSYLDDIDEGADEDPEFEKKEVNQIVARVSKPQMIDFKGHEIRADNSWIAVELAHFIDQKDEPEDRRVRIVSIRERILGIKRRISEMRVAETGGLSKDEQKQKLAEILNRVDYAKPEQEKKETWVQALLRRIDEWLSRKLPDPDLPKPPAAGIKGITVVLQFGLYALLAALIVFLLVRFVPVLIRSYRSRDRRDKGSRVILGEILDADETSDSLFDEAEALARAGDLRAAIRKGYIAFLCELSDRRLVGLAQHKTNRDYLRDVRREPKIHRGLYGLTERFERHWYGVEDADERVWQEFRETYRNSLENRT